jgi:hypothetical protein
VLVSFLQESLLARLQVESMSLVALPQERAGSGIDRHTRTLAFAPFAINQFIQVRTRDS